MAFLETSDASGQVRHKLSYPATRTVEQTDNYHGVIVSDPYRWLENDTATETVDWVAAQNRVTSAYLKQLPQRDRLKKRLTELYNYPRYSAPFKEGGKYFFFKNDGLQNQYIMYMQNTLTDPPHAILDPNTLSTDGTVALNTYTVSPHARYLAYGISESGSDWMRIGVRDITTGKDLSDDLRWVKFSGISWTHDEAGFFYSRYPEPKDTSAVFKESNIDQKIYYHRIGTKQSEDILILERPDEPDLFLNADVTEDGRYAIVMLASAGEKNRISYIDLLDPVRPNLRGPIVPLIPDPEAAFYFIGNDGNTFYFQTNLNAPRYRVIAVDINKPEKANWKTIIPEGQEVISELLLVGNMFVVSSMHNASSQIKFYDLHGTFTNNLPLPGIGSAGSIEGKRTDTEIFYTFTSYLYPTSIFRYDIRTGNSTLFRKSEVKFNPDGYETTQVFFPSKDGTRVPMFITCRKGLKLDKNNPTLLYGYGGFNVSLTPFFSPSIIPWLESGGVYVVVNLRGGGEFGEEWHQAGTKLKKQNVFDDFIAAAEYLCAEGYTQPKKLAMQGGSNGGLLVGAVMCQRPDLFAVALPAVGVMDMLRYDKFTIGSAWREDYGLSENADEFKALYAYSPYHNLKPGVRYPATMVETADHDDRVFPAHSFKFAARLQACQAPNVPALIRIESKAGHGAGTPISKYIQEAADEFAFAMYHLGVR